ncbi:MAG: PAS domain S-box protein [Gammaproteobacteria bacterium]|nr:PAS domain S-box protein [Gammaproteobacteria bacterium]
MTKLQKDDLKNFVRALSVTMLFVIPFVGLMAYLNMVVRLGMPFEFNVLIGPLFVGVLFSFVISTLNLSYYHKLVSVQKEQKNKLEKLVIDRTEKLRKLSRAVEQSHNAIVITDLNGKIEFVNPAFTHATGYSMEEALGNTPRIVKSGEQDKNFYQSMWDTLIRGDVWEGDLCNKRKDGTTFWEYNTISPLKDEAGKTTHYVAIKEDITARKKTVLELINARQDAEKSNQAKSEFLSNMSHELRTPMNAILGFSQLLSFDKSLNDEQKDSVSEIMIAGNHLLELINDVLDFPKIESGVLNLSTESVNIVELVSKCVLLSKPIADSYGITIIHDDMDKQMVLADRMRFKQVMLNLLSNAIKYNCDQGTVELKIQVTKERMVRVTILDTGAGIKKEKLDELFQPFNRLGAENSKVGGAGIGLTISRKLVEMMGGNIGVNSELGVGSQFWFELPQGQKNNS